ncbi:MAG: fructosamine kinase family protein [Lamprobacter sp.]|uniref:fructosamine kinase family protein n=1 Tax=Lamprobacter sp. TaxID=3100796 RepID=UPI002B25F63D|nr:fructosamine kinase family protein [Lamprobacter sp.]MEA3639174.1 fructosamine kinase family protein [Lamprobacter sp.]
MTDWQAIVEQINAVSGRQLQPGRPQTIGGGCINQAVVLGEGDQRVFIKLNRADLLAMFEAEAAGLAEMASTQSLRVPEPLCTGVQRGQAFIAMEYIALGGRRGDAVAAGRQLAEMHRATRPRFGWDRDNTIGSTPQLNTERDDWVAFWSDQRLGFQLKLAAQNGYGGRLQQRGEHLRQGLAALLEQAPPASLLHGDLWGGNIGYTANGEPVIFDPACYYGDREADLAMTELFGGFGGAFRAAYEEAWPLSPGYSVRKQLYNLYHILNHLNLFGGGYLSQAESMIERLLAELG